MTEFSCSRWASALYGLGVRTCMDKPYPVNQLLKCQSGYIYGTCSLKPICHDGHAPLLRYHQGMPPPPLLTPVHPPENPATTAKVGE